MIRSLSAIARAPALHFVLLGALLFAGSTLIDSPAGARARPPIVITAARVDEIREDYTRTMGSPPTAKELDALIAREADDEMLYREALLLGLDRGDPAVEWRVIEKMEFLYGNAAGDNAEALRRGLALGLQRDDVVVRTGLVTKMRLLAKGSSRSEEPRGDALEQALADYFERHRDDYRQPALVTISHIFLSGDESRASEARAMRERLVATNATPTDAAKEGDPFVAGGTVRASSQTGLAKIFGSEVATAITKLEPHHWSEPLRSPYGFHVVWVSERSGGRDPLLADVRSQVLNAYRAERQDGYLERMLVEIRTAYEVRVETEKARDA